MSWVPLKLPNPIRSHARYLRQKDQGHFMVHQIQDCAVRNLRRQTEAGIRPEIRAPSAAMTSMLEG